VFEENLIGIRLVLGVSKMKTYYDEVKKIYDEYVKVILPKTVTWVSDGTDVDYIYGEAVSYRARG